MKVKIAKEYHDSELNKLILPGTEIEVTQDRAVALIGGGVAFAIDSTAELEAQVAENDARIAELEAEVAKLKAAAKKEK